MARIVGSRCITAPDWFPRTLLPSSAALVLTLACGMCHGQEMAASPQDPLPMRNGAEALAESTEPLVDKRSKNTVDVGKAASSLSRTEAKQRVLRCWQDGRLILERKMSQAAKHGNAVHRLVIPRHQEPELSDLQNATCLLD